MRNCQQWKILCGVRQTKTMSETITYKCPNCGGGLQFDPEKQKYACEYCLSEFTQETLDQIKPEAAGANEAAEGQETETSGMTGQGSEAQHETVLYTCPSCGAEIVTDETTAATFCYYCHNPVILSGRLSGEYNPDYVIPFQIDREKAVAIFSQWMKKKRYVPKAFYSEDQIQKLSGVYFPYLMYSCHVAGELEARADRLRVWVTGQYRYTETQTYEVFREGDMEVNHVARNALKKANRQLVEGVLPFDMKNLARFTPGYLSGFVAERRDMEERDFAEEVKGEVRQFALDSLKGSVGSYDRVSVRRADADLKDERWEYALLPVWTLTYHDQAMNEMYYFTVNGQTGKVCGKLPVDKQKLLILFAEIFFPVLLFMLLVGYLI